MYCVKANKIIGNIRYFSAIMNNKKIKITYSIKDIKTKAGSEWAIVSVEIRARRRKWFKPYKIKKSEYIEFEDFERRVIEGAIEDLRKEENIKQIKDRRGKEFEFKVERNKILTRKS